MGCQDLLSFFGPRKVNLLILTFLTDLDPVTVEKEKVYVLVNERTEVHCNKPSGSPEPNITWEKEGGEKLSERFGVEGCCTLLNNRTRRKDAGKYTCTASNVYRSSHVNVEIIVLGKLKLSLKNSVHTWQACYM